MVLTKFCVLITILQDIHKIYRVIIEEGQKVNAYYSTKIQGDQKRRGKSKWPLHNLIMDSRSN